MNRYVCESLYHCPVIKVDNGRQLNNIKMEWQIRKLKWIGRLGNGYIYGQADDYISEQVC